MRIKCIENNIHTFSENKNLHSYLKESIHLDNGILPITKNKEYNVYSLRFEKEGFLKYLICDDDYSILDYPLFYLSDFFNVVDDRISTYWIDADNIYQYKNTDKLLTFQEWHNSITFFENLVNCSDFEMKIFLKYKKLIDDE